MLKLYIGSDIFPQHFLDVKAKQNNVFLFPENNLPIQKIREKTWDLIRLSQQEKIVIITYSDIIVREINCLITLFCRRNKVDWSAFEDLIDKDLLINPLNVKAYEYYFKFHAIKIDGYGLNAHLMDQQIDQQHELQDLVIWSEKDE